MRALTGDAVPPALQLAALHGVTGSLRTTPASASLTCNGNGACGGGSRPLRPFFAVTKGHQRTRSRRAFRRSLTLDRRPDRRRQRVEFRTLRVGRPLRVHPEETVVGATGHEVDVDVGNLLSRRRAV